MKISFVLGAGFSKPAGLPLVNEISKRFLQPNLHEYTLNFGSSEWKWKETASDPDQINGLGFLQIPISFLLECSIKEFLKEKKTDFLNYEEFYQWVLDIEQEGDQWKWITAETKKTIDAALPNFRKNRDSISLAKYNLEFCFIHLLDDMLWLRISNQKLIGKYFAYLDLITDKEHQINIFTLNHDLFFETLLPHLGYNFSHGFSTQKSNLLDNDDALVEIFDNSYAERIKLYKLHGSIDQHIYRYDHNTDRHGDYDYFKTLNYHTKHTSRYRDGNGNITQHFTFDIKPQIVTGGNKLGRIMADKMYSALYKNFQEELPESDKLIIVGYSYSDQHINTVIEKSKDSIGHIININPSMVFQYEHPKVQNINPLTEEIKLTP